MADGRWRVHDLRRGLGDFALPWDEANRALAAGHPLLDSRFVDALLRHFGEGGAKLCRRERDGKPVEMAILKPSRPGIWTSFTPPQAQVAPVLLAGTSGLSRLPAELPGLVVQVDLLCQDPDFSPAFQGVPLPHRRQRHALTMAIGLAGDFDAYWAARPKNLRAALRTRENRLAKAGLVPRVVRLERPGDMAEGVARFGGLEMSGWKGRDGTAVSPGNAQGRFYADILERFARTGQGAIYEYRLGERIAATQLALTAGPMVVLLKTAYAEDLACYSPGRLLLREVIRDAFVRHPGGMVEFYTNAGPDQLAWATGQRWIEHVSLYRNPAVGKAAAMLQGVRRLVRGLRRRPLPGAAETA